MPIRALIVRATAFVVDSFVMAYKNVVQQHSTAIPKGETSAGAKVTQSMSSNAIDPDLATMILNVPYGTSREEFNEKFKVMFENNDVDNGGSFYIQSKLFRAREAVVPLFNEEGILEKPQN